MLLEEYLSDLSKQIRAEQCGWTNLQIFCTIASCIAVRIATFPFIIDIDHRYNIHPIFLNAQNLLHQLPNNVITTIATMLMP